MQVQYVSLLLQFMSWFESQFESSSSSHPCAAKRLDFEVSSNLCAANIEIVFVILEGNDGRLKFQGVRLD
jgi:hypothetical protein